MNSSITGYAEGFYGRLLTWSERRQIIDALQHLGLTTYYYAPKEDPFHRLHWRAPYSDAWRNDFKSFCAYAHQCGIGVVAGVAPGLDFDFSELPYSTDFTCLVQKSERLLEDGADIISLLMDDIDADFDQRRGRFSHEGEAHAALANALGKALSASNVRAGSTDTTALTVWVTPRIYADELINEAADYLPTFVRTLEQHHCVLYCGSDVVAHTLDCNSANALCENNREAHSSDLNHRVIIWDNLYANDYCPRRLFVGSWARRSQLQDVLLNPTGMVHTDCLLLELMAVAMQRQSEPESEREAASLEWKGVLHRHGVPDVFHVLAPYFEHPHFNALVNADQGCVDNDDVRSAIEHCLWRWKTPLSREWYAFIFGLKHDLLSLSGQHPSDRVLKTQSQPLARVLLGKGQEQQ